MLFFKLEIRSTITGDKILVELLRRNLILNLSAARQLSKYLSMTEEYLEIEVKKIEQSVAIIIIVEEREILKMSEKMLSEEHK